ncbi:hypothetical protein QEM43_004345 [Pseudomonas putida]|nr:hypothetical protein [Pseudomonas putida]
MLKAHMDATEASIVAQSQIPANTGHTIHRGTPRENFIKNFLESHLSSNVSIGTGEIIDALSRPREPRSQYDIVIYRKNFPKLDFGGEIHGFMAESVVATIEVKSVLDQGAMDQAVLAAYKAKQLRRSLNRVFQIGWVPLSIASYVVAYTGPANMETVHGWIVNSHQRLGIPMPEFLRGNRMVPGTALDGVFVLGKGTVKLENTPMAFNMPLQAEHQVHSVCNTPAGALLLLFIALQEQCSNLEGVVANTGPYLANVGFDVKLT